MSTQRRNIPWGRARWLLPAATVAVCVALAAAQDAGPPPAPGGSFRLAVVDLDRVLSRSKEWADLQQQIAATEDRMRRSLSKLQQQVRILQSACENLPPGTEDLAEKRARLDAALRRYDEARERFEQQLHQRRVKAAGQMFNKLNRLIERHARRQALDLVLKRQDLRVSADRPVELGVVMTTASVLYAKDCYDITETIVRELNADYPGEIRER